MSDVQVTIDPEMIEEINSITSKRYALLLSAKSHALKAADKVKAAGAKTRHKVAAAAHSEVLAQVSLHTKALVAWTTALLNHPTAAWLMSVVGKGNLIGFLATNKTVWRVLGWAGRKAHSVLTTVGAFIGNAMIATDIKPVVKVAEVVTDAHAYLEDKVAPKVAKVGAFVRPLLHGAYAFGMITSTVDYFVSPEMQLILCATYLLWNSPSLRAALAKPFVWVFKAVRKTDEVVHATAEKVSDVVTPAAPVLPMLPTDVETVERLIGEVTESVKADHTKRAALYDAALEQAAAGNMDEVYTIMEWLDFDPRSDVDTRKKDSKGRLVKANGLAAESTAQARKRERAEKAAREAHLARSVSA